MRPVVKQKLIISNSNKHIEQNGFLTLPAVILLYKVLNLLYLMKFYSEKTKRK